MEINANANNSYIVADTRQTDTAAMPADEAANSAANVEKSPLSFREIASKYDVTNISPKEVDQLGAELRESGQADVRDILMLETHGAKFLSHLPGQYYGEERLNQRVNLLQIKNDQLDMARKHGDPTASLERQIDFLEEIQSQKTASTNNPLTSNTLAGLLSAQENLEG